MDRIPTFGSLLQGSRGSDSRGQGTLGYEGQNRLRPAPTSAKAIQKNLDVFGSLDLGRSVGRWPRYSESLRRATEATSAS